ncbi:hypothetical protein B0T17DRAFT_510998 [Bombardia bombarda]|uniref:Uncharacterized protein n=1 Tax=Bombardia bombarda TaxID=252184 RepID=A0AA39WGZ7_9PEZI|nr:hypothetical protein B0T17DRAFT_510998 [Bombardia bombarda]
MSYKQVRHARVASDDTIVAADEGHGVEAGDAGIRGPYHFINMDSSVTQPHETPQFQFQFQFPETQHVHQQQQQQPELPYKQQEKQQLQDPAVTVSPLAWENKSSDNITDGSSQKTRRSADSVFSQSGSWTYELVSMVVAFAAVASIIAVLAYYNGKPLPSWPYSITINAVIAILATVATASMSVPLSSGLGQLKWIRFKQGHAPLSDMEVYDDASRGALGAIRMLFRLRGGMSGSFGAVIMIIALLLNPFAQQMATYPTRTVSSPVGATNYRAASYGLALKSIDERAAFVPILPLKSAVYNGLFAENNKPWTSLPVACQTGNCTWEPFETLAVCYSCIDMTEYITPYCANGTATAEKRASCGWQVPSGAKLNSSAEVFSMTSMFPQRLGDMSYSTLMKLVFMGTESQSDRPGVLQPWAKQCSLTACIQTLNSTVTNGDLNETIISQITNDTIPSSTPPPPSSDGGLQPVVITSPATNASYALSMDVILAVQSWFSSLFRIGAASRNAEFINRTIETTTTTAHVVVNLTVGISSGTTFFDTDIVQAFYWNYYEYLSNPTANNEIGGIEMLMRDLAISMTVSMRSYGPPTAKLTVNGTAWHSESFVNVRWGFVAVPVLAVVLAAVFLAVAVWMTRRSGVSLWKTSVLAVLFHGLDEEARERFEEVAGGFGEKRREAKGVMGGRWVWGGGGWVVGGVKVVGC